MVKEQYEAYLRNIYRKADGNPLSEASLKHYTGEAVRKLNEIIRSKSEGKYDSIYDITSLEELLGYRNSIFNDEDFKRLNSTGNQMYSAGFNRYVEFAEGHCFNDIEEKINVLDMPVPVKNAHFVTQKVQDRDNILKVQSKLACAFKCQINPEHETFISEFRHLPYVECHHIIPLSKQKEFTSSLDCYANILVLCPTCHRFIHYGRIKDKTRVLDAIYDERSARYSHSGLDISHDDFMSLLLPITTTYSIVE